MTVITYSGLNTLKNNAQLIPGESYMITDLSKIEVIAKTNSTFYESLAKKTSYGAGYDEESFNFNTKILTVYDNVACIARCNNFVWSLLNDNTHKPYKMSNASNNLMLWYSKQNTYDKVIVGISTLDETYAGSNLNISCGGSIGLNYATIYLYKTTIVNGALQKTQMTLAEASILGSNIFYSGKMSKNIQL